MPTCTNQTGYNQAYAQASNKASIYQSLQASRKQEHDLWVIYGSTPPEPYPAPTYQVYLTAAECSAITWWFFYYLLGRVPSAEENTLHASELFNNHKAISDELAEFATCQECYNLWGCS